MDLFMEAMEESQGMKRVYVGSKVPRILRRLKTPIRRSQYTGKYYKLIGERKRNRELLDRLEKLKWE